MYRLTTDIAGDENKRLINSFVSDALTDWMECVLGETNFEGDFTDKNRASAFFYKMGYGRMLVESTPKGDGLLAEEINNLDMMMARLSDIYAKLRDQYHEYSFDEFGRLLIRNLVYLSYTNYDYLSFYQNNGDRFSSLNENLSEIDPKIDFFKIPDYRSDFENIFYRTTDEMETVFNPYFERIDVERRSDIEKALEKYGSEFDFSEYGKTAPDKQLFGKIYSAIWIMVLSDPCLYCYNNEDRKFFENVNDIIDNMASGPQAESIREMLTSTCYDSLLLKDDDDFIVERYLFNPEKLDAAIKTIKPKIGFSLSCKDNLFKDMDESYDI